MMEWRSTGIMEGWNGGMMEEWGKEEDRREERMGNA
jgi:hypothetical protein